MKWFDGSIPEAIQLAKSQNSLFVVFITGDDDGSRETAKVWDDAAVTQLSLTSKCVALKLDAKSQLGVQFAQIYPVMVVPSVFFISPETGLPLEVSVGAFNATQLIEKFNTALEMQRGTPSASAPSADGGASSAALAAEGGAKCSESPSVGGTDGSKEDAEACGSSVEKENKNEENDPEQEEVSLEEKKERLLQKMAERREVKEKELEENDRKREVDRRKLGQETQKFRQWKAEMEKKEYENSYKKEKEEQKRALEKIRADLERDRQERAIKYKQEKEQQQETVERAKKEKLEAEAKRLERENAAKRESSRVQFRMPDGSTITQVFSSKDSLATAKTFIQEKLNNKPVTLSTTYPKRTFVDADMTKTLLDLELVPSSVLIVLPERSGGFSRVATQDANSTSFVWMLLAPLIALWNFIYFFLFPPNPPAARAQETQNAERQDGGQPGQSQANRDKSPQQPTAQGLKSRKVGNVNRLTADDEDDESATWNGNSTQQM